LESLGAKYDVQRTDCSIWGEFPKTFWATDGLVDLEF
jgi:hypothetical protein